MHSKIFSSAIIPHICGIITISYTPFATIDPTSPIKMALIGAFAFGFLFVLFITNPSELKPKYEILLLLIFCINLLLVWIFSQETKTEQFYGTIGRNFGLLTQISLVIFCSVSVVFSSSNFILKLKKTVVIYGFINLIYGTLQVMGEDFYNNWDTTFVNSARGFFANPNQYSSFAAMIGLISISNLLDSKRKLSEHLGTVSFFTFTVMNIYFAKSVQGFVILGAGLAILFLFFLRQSFWGKKYFFGASCVMVFLALTAILDIFQKLPWKSFLYSSTIEARGDYWRAGISMGSDNPLTGVGLDRYLEWYRIYRDATTASRPGAGEVSNSAHNHFIDYFAFGGYPLLVLYSVIQLLALIKLFRIIKLQKEYSSELNVLTIIFTAYTLQSLISPFHIGIAIWGWVATGLILGWNPEKNFDKVGKNTASRFHEGNLQRKTQIMPKQISVFTIGVLVGALISTPYLIQDARFRQGVYGDRTYSEMYTAAYGWPKSATRMSQASWKLYMRGSKDKSLLLALDAVKYSPNNYYAWLVLYSRPDLTKELTEEAKRNINRLEPRPKNIKKLQ